MGLDHRMRVISHIRCRILFAGRRCRYGHRDQEREPSEFSVPAGAKMKLIVRNQDKSMSEFESVEFHREKTVGPGQEISVFVGPLDAGSYEFFDDFHPQNRGHLIVK
jgi:hypothetical protein